MDKALFVPILRPLLLNRCVRVGWKFLSPVEFRLLV